MEKYKANRIDEDIPEKTDQEKKQESTEKVVDTAATIGLDAATGGAFSTIKDTASSVPVVGKAVNGAWNKAVSEVSKVASKTPVGDIAKGLDDSGIADVAKVGYDAFRTAKSGGANQVGNVANATSKAGNVANTAGKVGDVASKAEDASKASSSSSKNFLSNQSSSTSSGGFLTDNLMSMMPKSLKIKITIGLIGVLFFMLIFTALIGGKDFGTLALTNESEMSSVSSNGVVQTISETSLSGGNGTILSNDQSLLSLLGQEKIDAWNTKISTDVINAGIGSGAAMAVAAFDLIQGALDEGIVIPYFWGGGHSTISNGVNPNWGASEKVTVSGLSAQPVGSYQPSGLDCSGFVSWALYNGGCKSFTPISASNFVSLGTHVSASSLVPGDIIAHNSHVMIVILNDGEKVKVAEAKSVSYGVVFSEYSYTSLENLGYNFVSMSDYYSRVCKG